MGFWICFNCGGHNVYEKMYVRLNRLACIIDDVEDLMEIEDNTKEPGTIVQEIQKGFMMKDRLLRPSLVGVSKKKLEKEESEVKKSEENKEKEEEK